MGFLNLFSRKPKIDSVRNILTVDLAQVAFTSSREVVKLQKAIKSMLLKEKDYASIIMLDMKLSQIKEILSK